MVVGRNKWNNYMRVYSKYLALNEYSVYVCRFRMVALRGLSSA